MQDINQLIEQYEFLVSRAIYKLNIYKNKEDYMQVGRISLWKAALDFDENKGEFGMFAYVRIRYAILRALKTANKIEQVEVAVESDQLILKIEQQESRAKTSISDLLHFLSDEESKLIWMIYFERKTVREVAIQLDQSYELIKKRKQRLLKKIKEVLEQME